MSLSSRTRYFLIAAVLFLLVGIATGLVAFYVGLPSGLSRRGGPEELRYVPRTAAVIAFVDVQAVTRSEVWRQLRTAGLPENSRRELTDRTGIDLERDVDRVVACLEPHPGAETKVLTLARGRFDEKKIEAVMRERGGEAQDYRGKRLIVAHLPGAAEDGFALSFIDRGLVALGSTVMVRRALEQPAGGENVTDNAELMDLVHGVGAADAWVAGRFDLMRADAAMPEALASQIPAVTRFTVSARVDQAIRGAVRADAKDEQSANNLRDVVRGFVGMAKLQAGTRPDWRAAVESIQLGGSGQSVILSFAVPAETIYALSQGRK
jgi:hypothetical protein